MSLPALLPAQSGHVTIVVHPDLSTGRLVRSVVVSPREVGPGAPPAPTPAAETAAPPANASSLFTMIEEIANAHNVELHLVHSIIRAESNYDPRAVSPAGAQGLMQLIPETAARFGVRNPFDPRQNIEGGVRYLRFLLDHFRNDYPKAIAAYNAGENAVEAYNGIPPYDETRNYVYQVARYLRAAREAARSHAEAAPAPNPAPQGAPEKPETYNPVRASIGPDGLVSYRTQ